MRDNANGEVGTDKIAANMISIANMASFNSNVSIFSYHAGMGKTGIMTSMLKNLFGDVGYTDRLHKYNNERKLRNKIKNRTNRFFKTHTYICKESKDIVNNALYVLTQEPGGWGGTYELLIVTKTGEVYRAEHDDMFNKYIVRVKQNISNKVGLFRYKKLDKLEKYYLRNDVQFKAKMEFGDIIFDAISYALYKKSGTDYNLMIERGSCNITKIYKRDIEYAEDLMKRLQKIIW